MAADRPEWDNPAVVQLGTEKAHATMMVYPTAELARAGQAQQSPWYQSLNGQWKFHGSTRPADRPLDFFRTDYNDSAWRSMPVPANWQLHGFDIPIYCNLIYPFPQDPKVMPTVPYDFNPVGSYRRTFTIPPQWAARQVYLHFAGVDSAFYVWVNGVRLGYHEDSRTPAEFNITRHLKPGANTLAVEVYRFGDGAYLEDQDMWRMSGIYREVFLWSTAERHVRDYEVKTDLDAGYKDAVVRVKAEVLKPEKCTLAAELVDAAGKSVAKADAACAAETNLALNVPGAKKWSAETPYLYKLLLTLKDASGAAIEVIPQTVGVRKVEIKAGRVHVNGQPILVKGVNRHEHSEINGKVIDRASMIKDIEIMKQYNVNSVRTSHYPNHTDWYDLCDQYGIYVMDEANIEAHHYGNDKHNLLMNSPEWSAAFMARVQDMVERDKNHASITFWSMGNETGEGLNAKLTYEWTKQRDPSRPFHYEGSTSQGGSNADINSFMYPSPEHTRELAAKRPEMPLILCEYSHAMGNSSGGLKEYWDLFYSGGNAQGAYVWDWVDQGLQVPVPGEYKQNTPKTHFYAYGGWWEDKTGIRNDNNFNNNGLVAADRSPHPGLYAIKYVYRYLHTEAVDLTDGRIKVKNWWQFTNAKDIAEGTWQVTANGAPIAGGKLPELDIAPGAEHVYNLPMPKIDRKPGVEYHLNVSYALKSDQSWAKKGHEIAWDQLPLAAPAEPTLADFSKAQPLSVSEEADWATIKGAGFSVLFDKKHGVLTSYKYKGTTLLERGPRVDFWRAATDNDIGAWKSMRARIEKNPETNIRLWRDAAPRMDVKSARVEKLDAATVRIRIVAEPFEMGGATVTTTHTVHGSGDIVVETAYQPGTAKRAMMPRFGTELIVAPGLENITWYGRGPSETYIDRQFERVGLYKSTVAKQWVEYMRPQENGNKTDVRWVALTNTQGIGLLAVGAPTLSVAARHFTKDDIERAGYTFQMQAQPQVYLNLDWRQMGVGGIDSWSPNALPMQPYRIPSDQAYSFSYRLTPVEGDFSAKTHERF